MRRLGGHRAQRWGWARPPPPRYTPSQAEAALPPPSVLANKPSHICSPPYITFLQWQKITADKRQLISSHYFEAIILKWETMLPGKSPITKSNTKLPPRQGRPICSAQKLTKFPSPEIIVNYCLEIFKDNFCFNPRAREQERVSQAPPRGTAQPWACWETPKGDPQNPMYQEVFCGPKCLRKAECYNSPNLEQPRTPKKSRADSH